MTTHGSDRTLGHIIYIDMLWEVKDEAIMGVQGSLPGNDSTALEVYDLTILATCYPLVSVPPSGSLSTRSPC